MEVYLVNVGEYASREVMGVYATFELARDAALSSCPAGSAVLQINDSYWLVHGHEVDIVKHEVTGAEV